MLLLSLIWWLYLAKPSKNEASLSLSEASSIKFKTQSEYVALAPTINDDFSFIMGVSRVKLAVTGPNAPSPENVLVFPFLD